MGPLEEEIKKIVKIAGVSKVIIKKVENSSFPDIPHNAKSIIQFGIESDQVNKMKVIDEIKKYIESKGHQVWVEENMIFTDLKLLPNM